MSFSCSRLPFEPVCNTAHLRSFRDIVAFQTNNCVWWSPSFIFSICLLYIQVKTVVASVPMPSLRLITVLKKMETSTDETMKIVRDSGILNGGLHLSVIGSRLCNEKFEEPVLAAMFVRGRTAYAIAENALSALPESRPLADLVSTGWKLDEKLLEESVCPRSVYTLAFLVLKVRHLS